MPQYIYGEGESRPNATPGLWKHGREGLQINQDHLGTCAKISTQQHVCLMANITGVVAPATPSASQQKLFTM